MALDTLIFGTDDLYNSLKPFYIQQVKVGNLNIVAYATFENGRIIFRDKEGKSFPEGVPSVFHIAVISSRNNFYMRSKILESQGVPRNRIIDGNVFKIPNLDFGKFLDTGVAYGVLDNAKSFVASTFIGNRQIYRFKNNPSLLSLDVKSYIDQDSRIDGGGGEISVGKFSGLSWNLSFYMGINNDHDHRKITSYDLLWFDWESPKEFYSQKGICKILIGNDVWVGRGCAFKSLNPNKPLTIGDGAVIASDSVVVKDVPPYAIVGGNPAQIIKYRFPKEIIESMLRIKWWDWDMDKIYENYKYFNDIEKFVSLHDK
ncbi:MAG: CatB-related O-acetyltransferase [Selenomonadaceae bacterium]|nr:CatB-related O-acetyltransferase [Selenomonadaceae bacterium]